MDESGGGEVERLIAFCRKRKKLVIIVLVVILVLCAGFLFYRKASRATMVISLNYGEASVGQNPDGTRFDENAILSDDVLQGTIDACALNTDTKTLLAHLSMAPVSNPSGYIAASYSITYTKIRGTDISPENVLKNLYATYFTWFIKNYSDNSSILTFSGIQSDDYQDVIGELKVKAQEMSSYLGDRLKENATFSSSTTGQDFKSLQTEADNIISVDIADLEAYVSRNGLSKNIADRTSILNYENYMLQIDYKNDMIGYQVREAAIGNYSASMVSVVKIPSKDTSGNYYMSRTKTGIDYLSADADFFLQQAIEVKAQIEDNNDILANLGNNANEDTDAKADAMIESILSRMSDLSNRCLLTDKDYIQYKTKNYISYTIQ